MRSLHFKLTALGTMVLVTTFSLQGLEISRIGIKAGVNMASVSGSNVEAEWKTNTGLIAGGFIAFRLSDMFSIQPEVLYSQKGAKWDAPLDGIPLKATFNLKYLDIPILIKFFIPMKSTASLRPNLFLGPYFGLKLSGKLDYSWGSESSNNDIEHLKGSDSGFLFGGGVDFPVGKSKICVDIRYGMSFSTISITDDIKNNAFSILIGYSFK